MENKQLQALKSCELEMLKAFINVCERLGLRYYLLAALANVGLNLLMIPLWGVSGAALATLIAQVITTMVAPFFIRPLRRNSVLMLEAIFFRKMKKI